MKTYDLSSSTLLTPVRGDRGEAAAQLLRFLTLLGRKSGLCAVALGVATSGSLGFAPKGIRCLIICLASIANVSALDLAPESISNSIRQIFYNTSPSGPLGPLSFLHSNNGGIYVSLSGVAITRTVSYSWTKTGPNTGTLQSPADITGSRQFLTFTLPGAGTFRNFDNTINGTFSFTPFELTEPTQVRNASSRMALSAGQPAMVGFVVAGSATRRVLVRAVGPSLAGFGVAGPAAGPVLTVFRGAVPLATNVGWGGEASLATAFASVGAFVLPSASADSALLLSLTPGAYTAQVRDTVGGEILVEVYFVN